MDTRMAFDWNAPEWVTTTVAWAASLVAAGGAKPAFDWWRGRHQDRRDERKLEIDTATALRNELRAEVTSLRADLDKRDREIDVIRREVYELLARIATLTAENHDLRAERHRTKSWIAGFYATLQMRWKMAGLPLEDFPSIPDWLTRSPDGPTASQQESTP